MLLINVDWTKEFYTKCVKSLKWFCLTFAHLELSFLLVDHIALVIELLGKVPRKLILAGKYSKEFFTKKGKHTHPATSHSLSLNPKQPLSTYSCLMQNLLSQDQTLSCFRPDLNVSYGALDTFTLYY